MTKIADAARAEFDLHQTSIKLAAERRLGWAKRPLGPIGKLLGRGHPAKAIAALEAKLGHPLAASHRAYLASFGAKRSWDEAPLGVDDLGKPAVRAALKKNKPLRALVEHDDPMAAGVVPFIVWPWEQVVFVPPARNGEMKLVEYFKHEEETRRYPNLAGFFAYRAKEHHQFLKHQARQAKKEAALEAKLAAKVAAKQKGAR
jgi:hypothetical protein